jgi:colanic acid biosynthesis glycosyl transferase WcaI
VLDTAEMLRERADVRIVLAGEGAAKAKLVAEAERRGLSNVTFLPSQPHDRMPTLIAAADACLASLRKVPLFEGALPSKMYEAMACGRPLILGVDGEARRLIEDEAGAALYAEPENPVALAEAVLRLKEQPDLARRLGQQGRAYVTAHFDRDALVAELEARLAIILGAEDEPAKTRASAAMSSTVQK